MVQHISLYSYNTGMNIVGVSLSEPHTSGAALRKCVNVHACLLAAYTVNYKPQDAT